MTSETIPFLLYTLLAIAVQGFFALFEMASVSFNKVRLQYYVTLGKRRAHWLNFLLSRPSRLFGTTLIGVNTALQIGSECSRRFYESIHLDPDWAPLTQIFIVVIFAELAPLFAARRHPEQVAMFCVPLMILIARLLTPLIWAFDGLSRLIHRLMGKSKEIPLFLSREEVRMAFEEKEEDEFTTTVGNIFQLKNLTALELMSPLSELQMVSTTATLIDVRSALKVKYSTEPVAKSPNLDRAASFSTGSPFLLIYHRVPSNVVAIATLRDLLRIDEGRRILDVAKSPWFVTQDTSVLQIMDQFRRNNQSAAVILDPSGQSAGLLDLDQIVDEIFGEELHKNVSDEPSFYIERTLSGEMLVSEFNRQFQADLPFEEGETLSDLISHELGHAPVKEEAVTIGDFLFTVVEPSLLGARVLSVETQG